MIFVLFAMIAIPIFIYVFIKKPLLLIIIIAIGAMIGKRRLEEKGVL